MATSELEITFPPDYIVSATGEFLASELLHESKITRTFLVETTRRRVVVEEDRQNSTPELNAQHRFVYYLAQRGFPVVPVIGSYPDDRERTMFNVYPYIEHREAQLNRSSDFDQALAAFTWFMALSMSYRTTEEEVWKARSRSSRVEHFPYNSRMKAVIAATTELFPISAVDLLWERYSQKIRETYIEPGRKHTLREGVIHGDWRPGTMLFGASDGRLYLIDWSSARWDPYVTDAGTFLVAVCSNQDQRKQFKAAIAPYFSKEELQALPYVYLANLFQELASMWSLKGPLSDRFRRRVEGKIDQIEELSQLVPSIELL